MLYYERSEVSEGIYVSESKDKWNSVIFVALVIFLNKRFKLQANVCNGSDDLLIMSMNLILTILIF